MQEAIEAGRVPAFADYDTLRREVTFEDSRIDLMLSGRSGRCYIEVKSVTLVEGGIGIFPDAPTERGRKHLFSLQEAVRQGHRAAVVFVIQRPDAHVFSPNRSTDPEFCTTLGEVIEHGVEAYAYRCEVSLSKIELADPVPIKLT